MLCVIGKVQFFMAATPSLYTKTCVYKNNNAGNTGNNVNDKNGHGISIPYASYGCI